MNVATKHFTAEQIAELAAIFNLEVRDPDHVLPVRDGVVRLGQPIWWRSEDGPAYVASNEHWPNIREYPTAYSVAEPRVKVQYLD